MDIKIIDSLRSSIDGLKNAIDTGNVEAEAKWQAKFDQLEFDVKKAQPSAPTADERAETKDFMKAARLFAKGGATAVIQEMKDAKVTSSLSGKSDNLVRFDVTAAGALLMPAEMSTDINRQVVEISPVLQVANVVNTSAPSFKQALRNASLSASWVTEDSATTKVKDTFGYIDIPAHKLAARVAWTIEQENDAAYNLESEILSSIREQFDRSLGAAFISGDGINKPKGLVGNVSSYASAPAALTSDALVILQSTIKSDYQRNASWMMNRTTMAKVRRLTISSGTWNYIWEPNFQAGKPSTLLGSPVYEAPDLAGTASNFSTADVPILYGDFRYGYTVVRNTDFFLIRDPYSEGNAFITNIYAMTRFGGAVVRSEAIAQYTSA